MVLPLASEQVLFGKKLKMKNLYMENVVTLDEDFDMESLLDESLPSSSISHEEDNNQRSLRFKLLEICRSAEDIRDEFAKFNIVEFQADP